MLLLVHAATSQSVKRVEIESDDYESIPHIVAVGEKGVLVFNESSEKVKGSPQEYWAFSLYNKDLVKSWSKKIPIYQGLRLHEYQTDDDYLYLLFSQEASHPQIHVLKVDINNGNSSDILKKAERNTKYTGLEVMDGKAFMSGYTYPTAGQLAGKLYLSMCCCFLPLAIPGYLVPRTDPVLYHADFTRQTIRPIEISYARYTLITNLSKGNNIYALIQTKEKNTNPEMYLEEYDAFGKKIVNTRVKYTSTLPLITGDVSMVDSKKVMIGVFSKASPTESNRGITPSQNAFAEGMYFTSFENGVQTAVKYYEFKDFNTFWSSIKSIYGERQAQKMQKRSKKKEQKGKEVSIGYRLLVHDIMRKGDELIMIAEAYYPEYHTETRTTMGPNGQMTTYTVQVFDGYRYTHAIVAGFDLEGNKKWDHSFKIGNILDMNLRERVKVMLKADDIVMAYSSGGRITSKVLRGQTILEGENSVEIESGDNADQVKRNYQSNIVYWYDNYFLSSGIQKIKNKEKKGSDRKRTVFYFNKVKFN